MTWQANFISEVVARDAGLPGEGWYPVNERGVAHPLRYSRHELCEAWIKGLLPVYRETAIDAARTTPLDR
jgi:hypothetical protein